MKMCRNDGMRCLPDAMRELYRWTAVLDAESAPRQRLLINAGMEICEPFAEFDLVPVDGNGAKCRPDTGLRCERQIADVARKKPADARAFELQISGQPSLIAHVHFASRD